MTSFESTSFKSFMYFFIVLRSEKAATLLVMITTFLLSDQI